MKSEASLVRVKHWSNVMRKLGNTASSVLTFVGTITLKSKKCRKLLFYQMLVQYNNSEVESSCC